MSTTTGYTYTITIGKSITTKNLLHNTTTNPKQIHKTQKDRRLVSYITYQQTKQLSEEEKQSSTTEELKIATEES